MKTTHQPLARVAFVTGLAIVMFLLAGMALVLVENWRSAEPSYQGQSLSHWLEQYYSTIGNASASAKQLESAAAIRHIGTNALPMLIRMLGSRDSRLKELMMKWSSKQNLVKFNFTPASQLRFRAQGGYTILGATAKAQVPELSRLLLNDAPAGVRQCAASALGSVGPEAESAAAALLVAAKDQDEQVRNSSLWALSHIQANPELVLPGLIEGLDDSFSIARENAAIALGRYGSRATSAIPALTRTMTINRAAHMALLAIDPKAASASAAVLAAPPTMDDSAGVPAASKPARPSIYDESLDGFAQIAEALTVAQKENKCVLLQFGANWCGWCHLLHKLFETDRAVSERLKADYVVVLIDVNKKHNQAVITKYGDPTRFGLPVIVILDSAGKPLTTKNTAELEEGNHHNPAKVLAFLKEWAPKK